MAVCFWYPVKRDLSGVRFCKEAYTSVTFYKVRNSQKHGHVDLFGLHITMNKNCWLVGYSVFPWSALARWVVSRWRWRTQAGSARSTTRVWSYKGWPVIHGRTFLAPCKKWLVHVYGCTKAYTGQITFYKVLEKHGHHLVGLYVPANPVFSATWILWGGLGSYLGSRRLCLPRFGGLTSLPSSISS